MGDPRALDRRSGVHVKKDEEADGGDEALTGAQVLFRLRGSVASIARAPYHLLISSAFIFIQHINFPAKRH